MAYGVSGRTGLEGTVVRVSTLDEATRSRMWGMFSSAYTGTTEDVFRRDLAEKRKVILVRDRHGDLQGFSTLTWWKGRHEGRPFVALFSGDTVLERAYWGDGALQRAFLRTCLVRSLANPLRPVYWFLISKGYKTYLLLSRHVPEHWPRRDRPTPTWEASLIDRLARDRFGAHWDPVRGIVRLPDGGHVRPGVAPADAASSDPDVAFFLSANPGHADGDELACLGRMRPWLPLRYALRRR